MNTHYYIVRIFKHGKIYKVFEFNRFDTIIDFIGFTSDKTIPYEPAQCEIAIGIVCGGQILLTKFDINSVNFHLAYLVELKNLEQG